MQSFFGNQSEMLVEDKHLNSQGNDQKMLSSHLNLPKNSTSPQMDLKDQLNLNRSEFESPSNSMNNKTDFLTGSSQLNTKNQLMKLKLTLESTHQDMQRYSQLKAGGVSGGLFSNISNIGAADGYLTSIYSPRVSDKMEQTNKFANEFSNGIVDRTIKAVEEAQVTSEGRNLQIELELTGLKLYDLEKKLDSCLSSSRNILNLNSRLSPRVSDLVSQSAKKEQLLKLQSEYSRITRNNGSISPKRSSLNTIKTSVNMAENYSLGEITAYMSPEEREKLVLLEQKSNQTKVICATTPAKTGYENKENAGSASKDIIEANITTKSGIATVRKPKILGKPIESESFPLQYTNTPPEIRAKIASNSLSKNNEAISRGKSPRLLSISTRPEEKEGEMFVVSQDELKNMFIVQQTSELNASEEVTSQNNRRAMSEIESLTKNEGDYPSRILNADMSFREETKVEKNLFKEHFEDPEEVKAFDQGYTKVSSSDKRTRNKTEIDYPKESSGPNHYKGVKLIDLGSCSKEQTEWTSRSLPQVGNSNIEERRKNTETQFDESSKANRLMQTDRGSETKYKRNDTQNNNLSIPDVQQKSIKEAIKIIDYPRDIGNESKKNFQNKPQDVPGPSVKKEIEAFLMKFDSEDARQHAKEWLKKIIDGENDLSTQVNAASTTKKVDQGDSKKSESQIPVQGEYRKVQIPNKNLKSEEKIRHDVYAREIVKTVKQDNREKLSRIADNNQSELKSSSHAKSSIGKKIRPNNNSFSSKSASIPNQITPNYRGVNTYSNSSTKQILNKMPKSCNDVTSNSEKGVDCLQDRKASSLNDFKVSKKINNHSESDSKREEINKSSNKIDKLDSKNMIQNLEYLEFLRKDVVRSITYIEKSIQDLEEVNIDSNTSIGGV